MNDQPELENIAERERFGEGVNGKLMEYRYESLRDFFAGDICLELGCADGLMTEKLVTDFDQVVAVDGSDEYCTITRSAVSAENLTVTQSLFQDFEPDRTFDTVLACHVLEHVEHPQEFLTHVRKLVGQDGRLLVDVPNANSLHRKVGVEMGLLNRIDELNARDKSIGHRRVYRSDEFHAELRTAGFLIERTGGVFAKPVTNGQMEKWFTAEMMDGFAALGQEIPHLAAEIFCVCSK